MWSVRCFWKRIWKGGRLYWSAKELSFWIHPSGFTERLCRYMHAWQKLTFWFQQHGSKSLEVAQGEASSCGFQQNTMTKHVGVIPFWCVPVPFPLLHSLHSQNSSCLFLAEKPQLDWRKMSFFALLIFAAWCMVDRLWCVLWKKQNKNTHLHMCMQSCMFCLATQTFT